MNFVPVLARGVCGFESDPSGKGVEIINDALIEAIGLTVAEIEGRRVSSRFLSAGRLAISTGSIAISPQR
jgi:hypothetical protein